MADTALNGTQEEPKDDKQTPVVEEEQVTATDESKPDDAQEVSEADESKTVPLKQYKDEISKRNSEASSLRQRLKQTETKYSTVEAERDAIREERDNLKDKLQSYELERSIASKAADPKYGARNPNKLLKLIDKDALTFKDDGAIEGIDDELKRLKKEWPELFVVATADGGAGGSGNVSLDFNTLIRRKAGR